MEHQDILKIFSESKSYEEVAEKIGSMSIAHWSQYKKEHGISVRHFTYFADKTPEGRLKYVNGFLSNEVAIHTHRLKEILFKYGVKNKVCEKCKLTKWLEQDIPLDLHHINGNNKDNSLDNLMVICPNCHRQTENYGSKNSKKIKNPKFSDEDGEKAITSSFSFSEACRKLNVSYRNGYLKLSELIKDKQLNFLVKPKVIKEKIIKPPKPPKEKKLPKPKYAPQTSITISPEEMKTLVWQKSQMDIGKMFGLSSVAITNFCIKHNIPTPTRGYWAKIYSGYSHEQALKRVVKPKPVEKIERIKERDARDILVKAENGQSFSKIAEEYGVHITSIRPMCFKHGVILPMGKKGRKTIESIYGATN